MKYWKTFYFISVSLLIFGCILALGKGFDIIKVLNTPLGQVYLFALFISTFVYMFFIGKRKSRKKIRFENLNIDKELFENWISTIIKCEKNPEEFSIEYEIFESHNSKVLTIKLNVLDLQTVNVGQTINKIKANIDEGLKNQFVDLLKDEIDIEFEIIKKQANAQRQKEEVINETKE